MPDYPHIQRYHAALSQLVAAGGSARELNIRPAFQNCLAAYCAAHRERLTLVPELRAPGGVIPDGTVKDSLRMARGYWEAKDPGDDLDAEIRAKFHRGYPSDNILFEDSRTAVLVQNGAEVMRVAMSQPGDLHRLIRRFLDYELPEIGAFRQARQQFKTDLPSVLDNLRAAVAAAESGNPGYQNAAAAFLSLCRTTISPELSDSDVREMLLQHILTKDIFLRVFAEDQFHRENNVARQLDALEQTFFTGHVRRQAIDRLRAYYGAIGRAADAIVDYAEKQQFLKAFYEDFYQAYNPAAADRLGVVYTPNEIVDFIIRGADWLLQKHFGRRLADDNVQILDPAVGTGTFITGLINYLPAARLEYKYRREIHANEVAILPYYIANLNIEYTYKERTGEYLEFPNLCFVDTLDNIDWQGASGDAVQRQASFNLGGLSEENWLRVQEQNEKPISVIIGNPPYNDGATLWGDGGANRTYPEIDRRIRDTYIAESTAQKTHQYDMYKRFLRWASDRLADDGVIAFITNRSYIDSRQDDGFRKIVRDEFSDLYLVDLGGDIRKNGKVGNVFNIMTGVAIGFLVRRAEADAPGAVHYYALTDDQPGADKLSELRQLAPGAIAFADIAPDDKHNWLNQSNPDFANLLPLANREAKFAKTAADAQAVFGLFTNAVKSNRDDWVYDFDARSLRDKVLFFADTYNDSLDSDDKSYNPIIKWSSTLRDRFQRSERIVYNDGNRIRSLWRPFVVKWHFAEVIMNDRLTRNHYEMFGPDLKQPNQVINFCVNGKDFYALATDKPCDFHFAGDTQCLPLYRYTPDGQRTSNITDWGLQRINDHYRQEWGQDYATLYPNGITAADIFAYTYAVLHDPVYRHDYQVDLRREFPRLPLYHDFDQWAKMGHELLNLHLAYETAPPYPLQRQDKDAPQDNAASPRPANGPPAPPPRPANGRPAQPPRPILRANPAQGTITLDSQTTLAGIPDAAWRYRLGPRSALEWILDQYKERHPRDPTIKERFNTYRFADHKESVIDLLQRICTISVATMDVVDGMAYWIGDELLVFGDRDKHEWAMLGLSRWFEEPEDEEWLASWSVT